MTIKEVQAKYDAEEYDSKVQIPDKLPEGHVFAEELSVRKNREMLSEANLGRQMAIEERKADKIRLEGLLEYDTIAAIMEEYGLSMANATHVREAAWERWHSNMNGYFELIEWLAETIAEALKINN